MAISDHDEHAPEIEATQVRQGRWGRHMLWVLLIGTALAFAALFGTWATRSGDLRQADADSRASIAETAAPPAS